MQTCQSCGGVLGRDCFNPQECAWITQDMQTRQLQTSYEPTLYEMGAMQDVVSKMRREMESAIESTSDGVHDSTEWWDDYHKAGGKTLIEGLLDSLERIAAKYAEQLSR